MRGASTGGAGDKARFAKRSVSVVKRASRFGLPPPGHILRVPRDAAGDSDKQLDIALHLEGLAGYIRRQVAAGRPLDGQALAHLVHMHNRRMAGKDLPPRPPLRVVGEC